MVIFDAHDILFTAAGMIFSRIIFSKNSASVVTSFSYGTPLSRFFDFLFVTSGTEQRKHPMRPSNPCCGFGFATAAVNITLGMWRFDGHAEIFLGLVPTPSPYWTDRPRPPRAPDASFR